MKNRTILGIDLGTSSFGWNVLEKQENGYKILEINNQKQSGVKVFPEIATSGGQSKAAERRGYRSPKKLKFRKKIRKYETLKVLIENKLCPLTMPELEQWKGQKNEFKEYPTNTDFLYWLHTGERKEIPNKENKYRNPYFLRDKISREKINLDNLTERYQLGRALYHMAQRRGFKSNRLEQTDDSLVIDLRNELVEILLDEKDTNTIVNGKELQHQIAEFFLDKGFDIHLRISKTSDDTEKEIIRLYNKLIKIIENKKQKYQTFEDIFDAVITELKRVKNLGKVKQSIYTLSKAIEEKKLDTLGQYFWYLYQKERKDIKHKIRGHYTSREEHYLHEFDVIMQKQFPDLVDTAISIKLPKKRFKGIALDLYQAIFFQRPLKSQKGKIGKCSLESRKLRMPKSHYLFEEFRMWSFINHIKVKDKGTDAQRFLTEEEKQKITPLFYHFKQKFEFKEIAEKIFGKDVDFKHFKDYYLQKGDIAFNYKSDYKVTGNPVSARLKKYLKDQWNNYYNVNKKITFNELAWHALFTFEDEEKLKEFAQEKLKMSKKDAENFVKIKLEQGYANLSQKAVRNILKFLKQGLIYSHAVFVANLPNILKKEIWEAHQKDIVEGIGQIIENRRQDIKIIESVNALIKHNRTLKPAERIQISDIAEDSIKKTLTEILSNEFGKQTWQNMPEKEKVINNAHSLLKQQLTKNPLKGGSFYPIPTLEDQIKDFLMGKNEIGMIYCSNDKNQLDKLYHPSKLERFQPKYAVAKNGNKIKILPPIQTNAINNPTLTRSLNQMRKIINHLLINNIIDNNTRIHIEMAREINSINQKEAIKAYQEKKEKERLAARQRIAEYFRNECQGENCKESQITDELITRYLLWLEQGKNDIYTGKQIGICDVICAGSSYDIDHIIPRKRSWDNSLMNKTLTDKNFNQKIKGNKIPYELETYRDEIIRNANIYKQKFKKLKAEIDQIKISPNLNDMVKRNRIKNKYVKQQEYQYFKGKYERFTMKEVPESFKNRQLVDIGLITTYAYEYLSTVFKNRSGNANVMTLNGKAVSTFRKIWGLPKKDRNSHLHHMTDAVIAASISKNQYEKLAEIWGKEDEIHLTEKRIKKELEKTKPWESFTEDVIQLEKQTLAVHFRPNNYGKQTKKKLRKRGKIVHKVVRKLPDAYRDKIEGKDYKKFIKKGKVYYKIPQPVYLQGDTARGPLNESNYIGAIKKDGELIYVKREKVSALKFGQVKDIVDDRIREIIGNYFNNKKTIEDKIKTINKKLKTSDKEEKKQLIIQKQEAEQELIKLRSIPSKNKGFIPINKVRIRKKDKPIVIKKQSEAFKSQKDYKQDMYAQNSENYGMAIYEKGGKREKELIELFEYYRHLKTGKSLIPENVIDNKGNLIPLKLINNKPVVLQKGMAVLLTKKNEEAQYNNPKWLFNRLYYIIGIDKDAIKMMHHSFGGGITKANKHMNEVVNTNKAKEILEKLKTYDAIQEYILDEDKIKLEPDVYLDELSKQIQNFEPDYKTAKSSNITSGKGGKEIYDNPADFPFIKQKVSGFDAKLENYHFKINDIGEIFEI